MSSLRKKFTSCYKSQDTSESSFKKLKRGLKSEKSKSEPRLDKAHSPSRYSPRNGHHLSGGRSTHFEFPPPPHSKSLRKKRSISFSTSFEGLGNEERLGRDYSASGESSIDRGGGDNVQDFSSDYGSMNASITSGMSNLVGAKAAGAGRFCGDVQIDPSVTAQQLGGRDTSGGWKAGGKQIAGGDIDRSGSTKRVVFASNNTMSQSKQCGIDSISSNGRGVEGGKLLSATAPAKIMESIQEINSERGVVGGEGATRLRETAVRAETTPRRTDNVADNSAEVMIKNIKKRASALIHPRRYAKERSRKRNEHRSLGTLGILAEASLGIMSASVEALSGSEERGSLTALHYPRQNDRACSEPPSTVTSPPSMHVLIANRRSDGNLMCTPRSLSISQDDGAESFSGDDSLDSFRRRRKRTTSYSPSSSPEPGSRHFTSTPDCHRMSSVHEDDSPSSNSRLHSTKPVNIPPEYHPDNNQRSSPTDSPNVIHHRRKLTHPTSIPHDSSSANPRSLIASTSADQASSVENTPPTRSRRSHHHTPSHHCYSQDDSASNTSSPKVLSKHSHRTVRVVSSCKKVTRVYVTTEEVIVRPASNRSLPENLPACKEESLPDSISKDSTKLVKDSSKTLSTNKTMLSESTSPTDCRGEAFISSPSTSQLEKDPEYYTTKENRDIPKSKSRESGMASGSKKNNDEMKLDTISDENSSRKKHNRLKKKRETSSTTVKVGTLTTEELLSIKNQDLINEPTSLKDIDMLGKNNAASSVITIGLKALEYKSPVVVESVLAKTVDTPLSVAKCMIPAQYTSVACERLKKVDQSECHTGSEGNNVTSSRFTEATADFSPDKNVENIPHDAALTSSPVIDQPGNLDGSIYKHKPVASNIKKESVSTENINIVLDSSSSNIQSLQKKFTSTETELHILQDCLSSIDSLQSPSDPFHEICVGVKHSIFPDKEEDILETMSQKENERSATDRQCIPLEEFDSLISKQALLTRYSSMEDHMSVTVTTQVIHAPAESTTVNCRRREDSNLCQSESLPLSTSEKRNSYVAKEALSISSAIQECNTSQGSHVTVLKSPDKLNNLVDSQSSFSKDNTKEDESASHTSQFFVSEIDSLIDNDKVEYFDNIMTASDDFETNTSSSLNICTTTEDQTKSDNKSPYTKPKSSIKSIHGASIETTSTKETRKSGVELMGERLVQNSPTLKGSSIEESHNATKTDTNIPSYIKFAKTETISKSHLSKEHEKYISESIDAEFLKTSADSEGQERSNDYPENISGFVLETDIDQETTDKYFITSEITHKGNANKKKELTEITETISTVTNLDKTWDTLLETAIDTQTDEGNKNQFSILVEHSDNTVEDVVLYKLSDPANVAEVESSFDSQCDTRIEADVDHSLCKMITEKEETESDEPKSVNLLSLGEQKSSDDYAFDDYCLDSNVGIEASNENQSIFRSGIPSQLSINVLQEDNIHTNREMESMSSITQPLDSGFASYMTSESLPSSHRDSSDALVDEARRETFESLISLDHKTDSIPSVASEGICSPQSSLVDNTFSVYEFTDDLKSLSAFNKRHLDIECSKEEENLAISSISRKEKTPEPEASSENTLSVSQSSDNDLVHVSLSESTSSSVIFETEIDPGVTEKASTVKYKSITAHVEDSPSTSVSKYDITPLKSKIEDVKSIQSHDSSMMPSKVESGGIEPKKLLMSDDIHTKVNTDDNETVSTKSTNEEKQFLTSNAHIKSDDGFAVSVKLSPEEIVSTMSVSGDKISSEFYLDFTSMISGEEPSVSRKQHVENPPPIKLLSEDLKADEQNIKPIESSQTSLEESQFLNSSVEVVKHNKSHKAKAGSVEKTEELVESCTNQMKPKNSSTEVSESSLFANKSSLTKPHVSEIEQIESSIGYIELPKQESKSSEKCVDDNDLFKLLIKDDKTMGSANEVSESINKTTTEEIGSSELCVAENILDSPLASINKSTKLSRGDAQLIEPKQEIRFIEQSAEVGGSTMQDLDLKMSYKTNVEKSESIKSRDDIKFNPSYIDESGSKHHTVENFDTIETCIEIETFKTDSKSFVEDSGSAAQVELDKGSTKININVSGSIQTVLECKDFTKISKDATNSGDFYAGIMESSKHDTMSGKSNLEHITPIESSTDNTLSNIKNIELIGSEKENIAESHASKPFEFDEGSAMLFSEVYRSIKPVENVRDNELFEENTGSVKQSSKSSLLCIEDLDLPKLSEKDKYHSEIGTDTSKLLKSTSEIAGSIRTHTEELKSNEPCLSVTKESTASDFSDSILIKSHLESVRSIEPCTKDTGSIQQSMELAQHEENLVMERDIANPFSRDIGFKEKHTAVFKSIDLPVKSLESPDESSGNVKLIDTCLHTTEHDTSSDSCAIKSHFKDIALSESSSDDNRTLKTQQPKVSEGHLKVSESLEKDANSKDSSMEIAESNITCEDEVSSTNPHLMDVKSLEYLAENSKSMNQDHKSNVPFEEDLNFMKSAEDGGFLKSHIEVSHAIKQSSETLDSTKQSELNTELNPLYEDFTNLQSFEDNIASIKSNSECTGTIALCADDMVSTDQEIKSKEVEYSEVLKQSSTDESIDFCVESTQSKDLPIDNPKSLKPSVNISVSTKTHTEETESIVFLSEIVSPINQIASSNETCQDDAEFMKPYDEYTASLKLHIEDSESAKSTSYDETKFKPIITNSGLMEQDLRPQEKFVKESEKTQYCSEDVRSTSKSDACLTKSLISEKDIALTDTNLDFSESKDQTSHFAKDTNPHLEDSRSFEPHVEKEKTSIQHLKLLSEDVGPMKDSLEDLRLCADDTGSLEKGSENVPCLQPHVEFHESTKPSIEIEESMKSLEENELSGSMTELTNNTTFTESHKIDNKDISLCTDHTGLVQVNEKVCDIAKEIQSVEQNVEDAKLLELSIEDNSVKAYVEVVAITQQSATSTDEILKSSLKDTDSIIPCVEGSGKSSVSSEIVGHSGLGLQVSSVKKPSVEHAELVEPHVKESQNYFAEDFGTIISSIENVELAKSLTEDIKFEESAEENLSTSLFEKESKSNEMSINSTKHISSFKDEKESINTSQNFLTIQSKTTEGSILTSTEITGANNPLEDVKLKCENTVIEKHQIEGTKFGKDTQSLIECEVSISNEPQHEENVFYLNPNSEEVPVHTLAQDETIKNVIHHNSIFEVTPVSEQSEDTVKDLSCLLLKEKDLPILPYQETRAYVSPPTEASVSSHEELNASLSNPVEYTVYGVNNPTAESTKKSEECNADTKLKPSHINEETLLLSAEELTTSTPSNKESLSASLQEVGSKDLIHAECSLSIPLHKEGTVSPAELIPENSSVTASLKLNTTSVQDPVKKEKGSSCRRFSEDSITSNPNAEDIPESRPTVMDIVSILGIVQECPVPLSIEIETRATAIIEASESSTSFEESESKLSDDKKTLKKLTQKSKGHFTSSLDTEDEEPSSTLQFKNTLPTTSTFKKGSKKGTVSSFDDPSSPASSRSSLEKDNIQLPDEISCDSSTLSTQQPRTNDYYNPISESLPSTSSDVPIKKTNEEKENSPSVFTKKNLLSIIYSNQFLPFRKSEEGATTSAPSGSSSSRRSQPKSDNSSTAKATAASDLTKEPVVPQSGRCAVPFGRMLSSLIFGRQGNTSDDSFRNLRNVGETSPRTTTETRDTPTATAQSSTASSPRRRYRKKRSSRRQQSARSADGGGGDSSTDDEHNSGEVLLSEAKRRSRHASDETSSGDERYPVGVLVAVPNPGRVMVSPDEWLADPGMRGPLADLLRNTHQRRLSEGSLMPAKRPSWPSMFGMNPAKWMYVARVWHENAFRIMYYPLDSAGDVSEIIQRLQTGTAEHLRHPSTATGLLIAATLASPYYCQFTRRAFNALTDIFTNTIPGLASSIASGGSIGGSATGGLASTAATAAAASLGGLGGPSGAASSLEQALDTSGLEPVYIGVQRYYSRHDLRGSSAPATSATAAVTRVGRSSGRQGSPPETSGYFVLMGRRAGASGGGRKSAGGSPKK